MIQWLDKISDNATNWIGSTASIIVHTLFFVGIFVLYFFKVNFDIILLVLTTLVSLEAIYLSIFIQRSVNQQTETLEDVEESLEDVEESIEEGDKEDEVFDSKIEKQLQAILEEIKIHQNK